MSNFVGHDATQDEMDLELGIISNGTAHHAVVVDTGKQWTDSKTKDGVLKLITGGRCEYPQNDVRRLRRFVTGILLDSARMTRRASQPD
jgi:hypothetical protein